MLEIHITTRYVHSQVKDSDGSTIGVYRSVRYPPTIRSTGSRLEIVFDSGTRDVGNNKLGKGFLAYYESIATIPDFSTMAISLTGRYNPQAVALLMSPLLNITDDDKCLKFVYSMRSNFRLKITSHTATVTLVNWAVDGGRAFHRAVIGLRQGVYKIIWETTDLRWSLGKGNSPHVRYRATVKEISILPAKCQIVGRCYHLLVIKIVAINFALSVSSMLCIALIALGMPHPHLIIVSWHMGSELQRLWEDRYHQYQTMNNRRQSSITE